MDKWARAPEIVPESERGASPEDAVSAAAVASSLEVLAVGPGADPGVTDVKVLGDGVAGTFHLREVEGRWLALGGEGCGAQVEHFSGDHTDCELPSDLPTKEGDAFLLECGAVEPRD